MSPIHEFSGVMKTFFFNWQALLHFLVKLGSKQNATRHFRFIQYKGLGSEGFIPYPLLLGPGPSWAWSVFQNDWISASSTPGLPNRVGGLRAQHIESDLGLNPGSSNHQCGTLQ